MNENSKRIAKNTLVLYVRMLFSMLVSLYTSRVILKTLGVDDYGIYNVVGGVVSMFSILSGSLSAAISRFLTFELGKNDTAKLKKVFSASVTIQIIIAFIIIIIAEVVGVWFLNNQMNIPSNRINAANWIFQFSLVTFSINLISVPYNAAIIAHEKMTAFAYIGIFEVLAKLGIVFCLLISPIDKLIFYGLLLMILAIVIRFIYGIYCKRNFIECSYSFTLDKMLLKEMFGFAGWNFIGASSAVLRDQGGNILLNIFGGAPFNAARGIAMQVNVAINGFIGNFMTAINPQITKSYASGEHKYMMNLIYKSARYSFYLLLLLSLPVIVNIDYILKIWLEVVPAHTSSFVQLVLIFSLSESLASPLITAMLATGKIRNYQIVVGGLQMLNLPISYICLKMGLAPESIFITSICISICCEITRIYMLRNMIGLSIRHFLMKVYLNVLFVFGISIIIPLFVEQYLDDNFLNLIISCIITICSATLCIFFLGCNKSERNLIKDKIAILLEKYSKTQ